MKTSTRKAWLAAAVAGVAAIGAISSARANVYTWDGNGLPATFTGTDWNTSVNWNNNIVGHVQPHPTDDLWFTNTATGVGTTGSVYFNTITSVVTSALTVNSLSFQVPVLQRRAVEVDANLEVNMVTHANNASDAFLAGLGSSTGNAAIGTLTMMGSGTLSVIDTSPFGNFHIDVNQTGGNTSTVWVEFNNLGGFNTNVSRFLIGPVAAAATGDLSQTNNRRQDMLMLPQSNVDNVNGTQTVPVSNITASLLALVGGGATNVRQAVMLLGSKTNMHIDSIQIGSAGLAVTATGNATMQFWNQDTSSFPNFTGALTITGKSGPKADLLIGVVPALPGSNVTTSVDFSTKAALGGLNLNLNNLTVGADIGTTGVSGNWTAAASFFAPGDTTSTMDATNIFIGSFDPANPFNSGSNVRNFAFTTFMGGVTHTPNAFQVGVGVGGTARAVLSGTSTVIVDSGGLRMGNAASSNSATSSVSVLDKATATFTGGINMANVDSSTTTLTIGGNGGVMQFATPTTASVVLSGGGIVTTASTGRVDVAVVSGTGNVATPVPNTIGIMLGTLTTIASVTYVGTFAGKLDMGGGSIGAPGNPISNLAYTGQILNAGNIYTQNFYSGSGVPQTLDMGAGTLAISSPSVGKTVAGTNYAPGAGSITPAGNLIGLKFTGGNLDLRNGANEIFNLGGLTLSSSLLNLDMGTGQTDKLVLNAAGGLDLTTLHSNTITMNLITGNVTIPSSNALINYSGITPTLHSGSSVADYFTLTPPGIGGFTFQLVSSTTELDLVITSTDPWTGAANGNYNNTANWQAGIVPNTGASVLGAVMPDAANYNITISSPVTITNISLSSTTAGYKLGGSSALTISEPVNGGVIFISGATGVNHTISAPLVLPDPSTLLSIGGGASLTLDNSLSGTGSITQIGTGTLFIRNTGGMLQNKTLNMTQGTTDLTGLAATIGNLGGLAGTTLNLGTNGTNGLSYGALATDPTANGLTYSGTIIGSGSLTKNGAGRSTLTGSNTFVGPVILNSGMLSITQNSSLGSSVNSITFAGNATLRQAGTASVSFAGSLAPSFVGTRAISINSNVVGTIDSNNNNLVVANVISGLGTFAKTGAGTVALLGANTVAGGVSLNGGSTVFANYGNFGNKLVMNGGTLEWPANTPLDISTFAGGVSIGANGGTFETGPTTTAASSITYTGAIGGSGVLSFHGGGAVLVDSTSFNGGIAANNSPFVGTIYNTTVGTVVTPGTYAGTLSGTSLSFTQPRVLNNFLDGTGMIIKDNANLVVLTNSNNFRGQFFLKAGTVRLANTDALRNAVLVDVVPIVGGSTSTNVNSTITGTGILDLNNQDVDIGGITVKSNFNLNGHKLAIGFNNVSSTFTGTLTDAVGGAILQKVGSGVLFAPSSGNHPSGIIISGGNLDLGPNTVTVNSLVFDGPGTFGGATLGSGTGSFYNAYTVPTTIYMASGTFDATGMTNAARAGLAPNGHLAGGAALVIAGPGTFSIAMLSGNEGSNTYTGGTYVSNATLALTDGEVNEVHPDNQGSTPSVIGTGTLFMTNADLVESGRDANANDSGNFANNVNLSGINSWDSASINRSSQVRGTGTLNFTTRGTSEISGDWSNFVGRVNIFGNNLDTSRIIAFNTTTGAIGNDFRIANVIGIPNSVVSLNSTRLTAVGTVDRSGGSSVANGSVIPIGELEADQNSMLGGGANSAGVTWQIGGLGTSSTFAGRIADASLGATSIEKVGAGDLFIGNGSNSFSGSVIITAGSVTAGDGNALQNAHLVINAGTFDLHGLPIVTVGGLAGAGGIVTNTGGPATLDINTSSNDASYVGSIQNGGGTTLVKDGPGTTVLATSTTNSYTGGTQINNGVLEFATAASVPATNTIILSDTGFSSSTSGAALAIPSITGQAILSKVDAGSAGNHWTLALAENNSNNFTFSGFTGASLGGLGNVTYTGTLTPDGTTYRLGGGTGSITLPNNLALAGANDLVVGGSGTPGTVVLAGSNSYSGVTNLAGGNLSLSNLNALGSSNISFSGGILMVTGTGVTNVDTRVLNYDNFSGGFNIASSTNSFTVNSAITASNGTGFIKDGPGSLSLNASNTYSGQTQVLGGTLAMTGGSALGGGITVAQGAVANLSGTNVFNGGLGNTVSGVLSLTGTNSFSAPMIVRAGGILNSAGVASYNGSATFAGTTTFGGTASFIGGFTVSTGGLAVVNGTTSYVGGITGTIVNGGTVVFASAASRAPGDILHINNTNTTPGSGTGGKVIVKGDAGNIFTTYRTQLAASYDTGAWDNTPALGFPNALIITDTSGGNGVYGIGYMKGSEYTALNNTTSFGGIVVGANDVLLKYTIAGDANLDGRITSADFALVDAGFLYGGNTWAFGDFDYNGIVDFNDKFIIDNDFANQTGNTLADDILAQAIIAQDKVTFGEPFINLFFGVRAPSAVPEPASLSLLALGAIGLLKRRR